MIRRQAKSLATLTGALLALAVPAQANALTSYAYVANAGYDPSVNGGTVSVINTSNNAVVATVPAGDAPIAVATTPDGKLIYVVHLFSPQVSTIATSSNTVTDNFEVEGLGTSVAISPDGQRAYIGTQGFTQAVEVVDTATNAVIAHIPVGDCPQGVAVSPDGSRVYAASSCDETVSVIDTATNTVVATIPTNNDPGDVAVSPSGAYVYVTGWKGDVVIDPSTNTVAGTLPVTSGLGLAFSPDSSTAYLFGGPGPWPQISAVATSTKTITASLPVGEEPRDVALSPNGDKAYVTNEESDSVTVANTASNTVAATVPVGNQPIGLTITPPIEVPESAPAESGGSINGTTARPASPTPSSSDQAPVKRKKALKCRKGFKKRKAHGKTKCVKVKKHRH